MSKHDPYGTPAKPDSNCRTCTDFKYWSKQQRQIFHKADTSKETKTEASEAAPNGCPLDKVALGRATWGLLHTMAAFYQDNPTDHQKKDIKTFLEVLSRVYPCEHCAKDFRKDLKDHPAQVNSQYEFSQWLCKFHNRVNVKLGKPQFDCSKVNERWRDGWLDGSCD
ncbi:PREDICTED: FAD-linked sulfhydryl oxidase ALR [Rhagoletis zephyria]|uniref:FAD-linked sulfhydryl oxidase ALR n=1 Tax=Rhagoletis zephyria TaxID=28612 RepID=UPI0008119042|nr:PREDICTED: FAD-linked sulfhydryl oxidase ALR [Rhagoletis zephyria]